jgi:hypothetical protein
VREKPDQPMRALHRELGVAVEGNDESDPHEAFGIAAPVKVARLRISPEQAVELFELSALSLPTHESLFGRVPARRAM